MLSDKTYANPIAIETLQEEKERSVFKLWGAGPLGSNVIAKRSKRTEAIREYKIYMKILPLLPMPSPQIYSFREENNCEYAWLFIEDVEGENYSPTIKNHRILAARWLGLLHTSMVHLNDMPNLRDRGPDHFYRFFRPAKETILKSLSNPQLSTEDIEVLKGILLQCKLLEMNWDQINRYCQQIPQTLVHGDFKEDNMHVQTNLAGDTLMVFDWHEAGWGVPALDCAKFLGYSVNPSINAYFEVMRDRWSFMDLQNIRRLGYIGETFRCLASIRWEVFKLQYGLINGPISTLKVYMVWMDDIIQAEPWRANEKLSKNDFSPLPRHWN
jgi:hypothetical protein